MTGKTVLSRKMKRAMTGTFSALALTGSLVLAMPMQLQAAGGAYIPSRGQASAPPGAHGLCGIYSWACSGRGGASVVSAQQMSTIRAVNSQLNRAIRPVEDVQQYGMREFWSMPTARGGDCEDYVLAKKHALIRQGINPANLLIATVLDRKRNPHAVLVVRSAQGDLVLDNVTNQIRSWRATRYVFLRMQDPNSPSRWMNVSAGG
ncbi:transglutaminase-like cysteine peptidase [Aliiroseovarius marinus]|uniref:transglutaminase-like cysteine peptidase n=1 Tax=Aliiroseovarius marinus TaxID=2500159 RepID=UPI003D7D0AFB